jgi:hypothetical protein
MRVPASLAARVVVPHTHAHQLHLSRRKLLQTGAATTAAVIASGFLGSSRAAAAAPGPGTPKPIPANPNLFGFHVQLPGGDPSTITDFNGAVGIAAIAGSGVGTGGTLAFDIDNRFMQGVFRGTDGRIHQGTFAFV